MKIRRSRPLLCGQTNKDKHKNNNNQNTINNQNKYQRSISNMNKTNNIQRNTIKNNQFIDAAYESMNIYNRVHVNSDNRDNLYNHYSQLYKSLPCLHQNRNIKPMEPSQENGKHIQKLEFHKNGSSLKTNVNQSKNQQFNNSNLSINPSTLKNIKNLYKDKTNVRKVVKAWNLIDKGYITPEQFQLTLKAHFNIQIPLNQSKAIVAKFTNLKQQNQKLDTEGLVTLFFAQNINSLLIHKAPLIKQTSQLRNHKIQQFLTGAKDKIINHSKCEQKQKKNLNQYSTYQLQKLLTLYQSASSKLRQTHPISKDLNQKQIVQKMRNNQKFKPKQIQALQTIISQFGFDKTINKIYNFQDITQSVFDQSMKKSFILHKDRNKSTVLQTKSSFLNGESSGNSFLNSSFELRFIEKNNFSNSSSSLVENQGNSYPFNVSQGREKYNQLNKSIKQSRKWQFCPKQMKGINQQKSRFGANPTKQSSQVLNPLKDSINEGEMSKNSNFSNKNADQIIKQQIKVQKQKYQLKLQRIRSNRLNEKMRLGMIDEKQNLKNDNKLANLKSTLQGYLYVNYLKNQWL